ncbi:C45 family peptidase [Rhizobium sp. NXC24]|uniref:C45 family autoproteolytic acyltransferase/hydolase n=1 Tax=Rhizobium sp. NXC24 TaxID=2048897 RepID=UPI000CDF385F|nr:C45 family peptidase [Rhizobium sp. NXC24]AVA24237.1 acyl-coenzyme A:6-aminopenicillanic acid acyl-transferase family protein [Rhizobium sp. NXC24]
MRNSISRVYAQGDAFSMGFALGKASGIHFEERTMRTEEFQALQRRWRNSDYVQNLESAARAAYPRFVREIEGIAEGAGQDFQTVFLWNCRGDLQLPDNVSTITKNVAATGCTSILIPANGNEPAAIAHNEDGGVELLGACSWVEARPDAGLAWSSFMYPCMLPGHTFGVNEAGVVQTINNIRARDLKPGVPRQIICRAVLEAADLDDAVNVLKRKDRASGFHHNLGEAKTGRLLSVEAPASGCAVREPTSPQAHANHLLYSEFDTLEQTISLSSRNRQEAAARMITEGLLTSGAETVLFEDTTPIHCDRDRRDDYAQTLATSVFTLFPDRVEWRIHASPEQRNAIVGEMRLTG